MYVSHARKNMHKSIQVILLLSVQCLRCNAGGSLGIAVFICSTPELQAILAALANHLYLRETVFFSFIFLFPELHN